MQARGRFVLAIMAAVTLLVALAEPAEARRRFRFFSFGGGGGGAYAEKIDKVYDLPDTATYSHDGQYYDLGALYTVRDGDSIYPAEPGFVLYNGDRYVKLDSAQLDVIRLDLGMDPTASYRATYSAKVPERPKSRAEVERLPGETTDELRARVRKMAAERGDATDGDTAAPTGKGGVGALFIAMLVIGGGFILWLRSFLRRRVRESILGPEESSSPDSAFNQRVAARLRELEIERQAQGHGQSAPEAAAAPAMAAPRTFGRKLA
ncbi:hypothetical protein FHS95_004019 [Sphingomonas naasensis]|uniref:Uncharacterized protein n=1 Tax=Sphingomonas naasensis TaxID=1344951 RepID=A0A4V3QW08_9SPHN|nr:hypothetical protein [Sphingomonas naasensis]NIJ22304.1 hypothetical protein [Sphingomonas naasensis]TGX40692.1 hypothetical protein E5A74_14430 [Sphingomonas naasensis]